MAYIIDGHNLIPKIPGLTLKTMDDETQLVAMLQEFSRRQRKGVEVYFDKAPPGQSRTRKFGTVTAHFVRQGMTADSAIGARLERLGNLAANWTVVSSDHAVQRSARQARARYLSSEAFAGLLLQSLQGQEPSQSDDRALSSGEVDEWLKLFGADEE